MKTEEKRSIFAKERIWLVLVVIINVWNCLSARIATYDFLTPIFIIFPWFLVTIMSRDKRAKLRALAIGIIEYILAFATIVFEMIIAFGITDDYLSQYSAMQVPILIRRIYWLGLIAYAFAIRNEVIDKINNRITVKKLNEKVTSEKKETTTKQIVPTKSEMAKTTIREIDAKKSAPPIKQSIDVGQADLGEHQIDINKCGEEDFLLLPGMSIITAKRAVQNREENGNYSSLDDFVARNGIKPHFMIQMESMIVVTEKKEEPEKEDMKIKRTRTLDL